MPPEKNAAKILKEWPVFTSDGERLKVVNLVVAKVVYMEVETVDKEARGGALTLGGFSVGGCRKQGRRRRRKKMKKERRRGVFIGVGL